MTRRIHTPRLHVGRVRLDPVQARHARTVLRLGDGAEVEVFDDAGRVARGTLVFDEAQGASVAVARLEVSPAGDGYPITVASAVPKGDRADWMVEKLSELGAAAFLPLATARSVVLPEGRNKRDRWARLATESAKQSRRPGVMRIDDLTPVAAAVRQLAADPAGRPPGWYLSTEPGGVPIYAALRDRLPAGGVTLFVGPEGGWTDEEAAAFRAAGLTPVRLTGTILRVETAAVAAAAVVASYLVGGDDPRDYDREPHCG